MIYVMIASEPDIVLQFLRSSMFENFPSKVMAALSATSALLSHIASYKEECCFFHINAYSN